jgi:hypothetical protein
VKLVQQIEKGGVSALEANPPICLAEQIRLRKEFDRKNEEELFYQSWNFTPKNVDYVATLTKWISLKSLIIERFKRAVSVFVLDVEFEVKPETLIGPNIVHELNMSSRWDEVNYYSPLTKSMSTIWSIAPLDLKAFLKDSENIIATIGNDLLWKANGTTIVSGILNLNIVEPDDLAFDQYDITVEYNGVVLDRLRVIVIPQSTYDSFMNWYNQEILDMAWLMELPKPYSSFTIIGGIASDPEPLSCDPQLWNNVTTISTYFHPDGSYEMRSKPTINGHGHQAVYSSNGVLILGGVSSGTADKRAPSTLLDGSVDVINPYPHVFEDVQPFIWAVQLDGNPCVQSFKTMTNPIMHNGKFISKYLEVRPPYTSGAISEGTCQ